MSDTAVQPVQISDRFRLPFFPMRPRLGTVITKPEDMDNLDPDYHWSLKLNGDRALMGIVNKTAYFANRHGSWFKFNVENSSTFTSKLKGSWLFDGEVFKKNFYPFELVESPDGSMTDSCPSVRAAHAREVCRLLKVAWMYGTKETLRQEASPFILELRNTPYEGVVGKLLGSRYVPLGSASRESNTWVKRKWTP
jgi:ATP-dependent DNA ligase